MRWQDVVFQVVEVVFLTSRTISARTVVSIGQWRTHRGCVPTTRRRNAAGRYTILHAPHGSFSPKR